MIGHLCLVVGGHVAAVTNGGQPLPIEFPYCSRPVARIAVSNCMSADQWEAIGVPIDHVARYLPAGFAVAYRALLIVPVAVNVPDVGIDVAVLAMPPHLGEHAIDVAFVTCHPHMHSTQRETRLRVVKFNYLANRSPCVRYVTFFTRQV